MKKIMFNLASITLVLLISAAIIGCGGGGGGGGGSSSGTNGEQGSPSGTSTYASTYAFPYGFFRTAVGSSYMTTALWILDTNSNSALYFHDASHACQVSRVGSSNVWERTPTDVNFNVVITSGSQGYIRFSADDCYTSSYSYNVTDDVLVISNTYHGTKYYQKAAYNSLDPWTIQNSPW